MLILPVTKILAKQGHLPNLKKLMETGSTTQILPSFPQWTPTNWATVSTGANTGTHGVFGWQVKMPTGQLLPSFDSSIVNAETIWEAAEKHGIKSGIIHYPASMPSRLNKGYVVDGYAIPGHGECRYEIAPSTCYINSNLPNFDHININKASNWKNLGDYSNSLESEIQIIPKFKGPEKILHLLILNSRNKGFDKILICKTKDVNTKITEINIGEWSDWIYETFMIENIQTTGTIRFKLIDLSKDGSKLKLYRSQIMPLNGFTDPDTLGEEMIKELGPYLENVSMSPYLFDWIDFDTFLDEARYQNQWLANGALYLANKKGVSLFYSHTHVLDDPTHSHLAQVDPSNPYYNEKLANEHWNIIRKTYQVADDYVGSLLNKMNKDDYLVIVSDHGNMPVYKYAFLDRFLVNKGYLVRKDKSLPLSVVDPNWEKNIDWKKTNAYLKPGITNDFSIYVTADEAVTDQLIYDLRTWVDEETGQTPIAIALKKRDAALLGCWGDDVGDIVVVLEPGYIFPTFPFFGYPLKEESIKGNIASLPEVMHASPGQQIPTYQTDVSSHLATLIVSGPNIKENYERPTNLLGYIKMVDIVPTLCYILGIPPPAQSQGAIAYDLFQGNEMVRQRSTKIIEDKQVNDEWLAQRGIPKQREHYLMALRKLIWKNET